MNTSVKNIDWNNPPTKVPVEALAERLGVKNATVTYRLNQIGKRTLTNPRDRRKRVVVREDALELLRVFEDDEQ